jgi:hypothetical protein
MNGYMLLKQLIFEIARQFPIRNLSFLPLNEDDFVSLQKKSFVNRSNRTNLFVDKLKQQHPIDLTNGQTAIIDKVTIDREEFNRDNFDDLKKKLPTLTSRNKLKFFSGDKSYNISAFAKTTELGGKGKGGTLGPERKALSSLQAQLSEIGKEITLSIGGVEYKGINGVTNVKENQKADFAFTRKEEPIVFISYKPGSSPRDMISYGGITPVKDIAEVQNFIKAVQGKTNQMKAGDTEYGAPVTDSIAAQKTMFGFDFGSGTPGLNNVQAIVQGSDLQLVKEGEDTYSLKASHLITPSSIPTEGEFAPYYNARYADDRSQFGIKNCRFNIVPMGARKNIKSPF